MALLDTAIVTQACIVHSAGSALVAGMGLKGPSEVLLLNVISLIGGGQWQHL